MSVRFSTLTRPILLTVAVTLVAAAPAFADSLASIPSSGDDQARVSFAEFAEGWIARLQRAADDDRRNPAIRPGAASSRVEYRGVSDDYQMELRPTGHPAAPFVGILRYTEKIYSCRGADAANCSVASASPVTEIFRFQDGRWVY